jgi:predicted Zn-dependent protease
MIMKKLTLILLIAVFLISTVAIATIETSASKNGSDNKKEGLEKIVFIHYKKGYAKPNVAAKQPTCYKFLTPTKVKWPTLPVSYVINPVNPVQSLDQNLVVSAVFNAAEEWDSHTSKEIMSNSSQYNIDYSVTPGVQDYKNVIGFGNYPEAGVIAVTTVWYNPATKAIVEFDMMLDTDWVWGDATVDPSVMDLQNIATHEFGHAIGLGDVYNSYCSEVTMYGYSDYGEVKKRTLEQPDITGLQALYGA